MNVNEKLIQEFIDEIPWEKVWNHDFAEEECYQIENNIDSTKFELAEGATKCVAIPIEDTDFVIKVPFRQVWHYDPDDPREDDNYFSDFVAAPYPLTHKWGWNYCHTEIELYTLAEAEGLSMLFPTTVCYCEDPYPIYLQERCLDMYAAPHSKMTADKWVWEQNLRRQLDKSGENWVSQFQIPWLQAIESAYGREVLIQFFKFLTKYHMKDFHNGNYGYSAIDGRPVLIDFAGFYD